MNSLTQSPPHYLFVYYEIILCFAHINNIRKHNLLAESTVKLLQKKEQTGR
jgi:hypothetical protein